MIKISNNLLKLAETNLPLHRNPLIVGAGTGLLGGGLGAGLFHLMAKEKNKTLLNYLLAATAGAVPSSLLGYGVMKELEKGFDIADKNPGDSPEDALPGAIDNETGKAKAFKDS